ncbi:uracil phosphoribosyltransferase-domain-containing protein [Chiua virens]|nr:uracil phosphoribosyltransferase-domain-containing protein [Chiua virens]
MSPEQTSPPGNMAADQLKHPADPDIPNSKPIVIGIYGIPGSGKTFLLNKLTLELKDSGHFSFYEGSAMISSLVFGGLEAFHKLPEHDKTRYRQLAITTIGNECATTGRAAIIVGHFMFWAEGEEAGKVVCTRDDLSTYTHIIYLGVPAEEEEKTQLHRLCIDHGILFSVIGLGRSSDLVADVSALARDFRVHTEEYNLRRAKSILDQALGHGLEKLETVLVVDGDRTLAAADTGPLFWRMVAKSRGSEEGDLLKELFSGPLGYSYAAFRQANLLYEEVHRDLHFSDRLRCRSSGSDSVPRVPGAPEAGGSIRARPGGSKPSGTGPISNNAVVVNAEVKAALVAHVHNVHHCHVFAFGDSPLDLDMLSKADKAIVVVGEDQTRSKTMEAALLDAIDNGGLRARQVLLPSNVLPRLDTTRLPLVDITDPEFIESVFRRPRCPSPQVLHATSKSAAKLLMTPTRDATIAGPALRDAHRRNTEFPHVQGHQTEGHRLIHEQRTLIIALMRGGEAMAFGVNDAFPLAMFVHAKRPEEILPDHVEQQHTVLLVDSVINNGNTAMQFIRRVRDLHAGARIVVVAGVVQSQAITGDGPLARALVHDANLNIVALRLSDNKYTGRGHHRHGEPSVQYHGHSLNCLGISD